MDPEANKPDEFEAKIKILTDIVTSLGRSVSEHDERWEKHQEAWAKHQEVWAKLDEQSAKHDERLAKLEEQVSRLEVQVSRLTGVVSDLAQVSTNHQQAISRLIDITTALAENAVTQDRRLAEQRENLDILTRTVDDWIRRNPRGGSTP